MIKKNNLVTQFKQHPKYGAVLNLGKMISITGGAQIIVQALGFASGILIIRLLPVEEYGLYTLANTLMGAMMVLGDGGLSTGVMSQGAKVWQNKEKLGAVLATGLDLRRKFAIVSLTIFIPILIYLLIHNNASWLTSILISISLIPGFYAALSDCLIEMVPKLHQDIIPLQKNQISVGIFRLIIIGLTMFIFPWAFIAVLANGIPRIFGNIKLQKIADKFIDKTTKPDPVIQKEIIKIVQRILPGSIYFCLSGQITIWVISIFGTTVGVAQLGALGRFAMLLNIFTVLINTLIIPRFARLELRKKVLLKASFYTISIVVTISVLLLLFVSIFSNQLLLILGNSYKDLKNEMLLSVLIGCINLGSTIFSYLSLSRGWVINPILMIIFNLFGSIFPFFFVDVSTLNGVLMLSLFSALCGFLLNGSYIFFKILRLVK
ncbi:MATE family efflux transporter [Flavobacterium agrisoli]|uniref:Polysaccharide biosynthesis protein n=1 Tax=Flavobacterium agrisoli TaxID=2793066 RepID=A0A934PLY4_9FLAO|nr:polysaccharide biosynthesis protein [Flavobacterium agrisoli]MBK0368803.1 polysaccharide biosynthesis protein [Flavobacterium agrisoli]